MRVYICKVWVAEGRVLVSGVTKLSGRRWERRAGN
jgi:hypothetical protein